MWNIFQQPWTLTGAAVLVLFVVLTVRSVWPEKHRVWHFLFPIAVVGLAFGLDHLVKTDTEKVYERLDIVTLAIQDEDYDALEQSFADDYRDSLHSDKASILGLARRYMGNSLIESTRQIGLAVRLTGDDATALLSVVIHFGQDSHVAQAYKATVMIKMRIYFRKQPDGLWLINSSELLEVDRQPMSWRQV